MVQFDRFAAPNASSASFITATGKCMLYIVPGFYKPRRTYLSFVWPCWGSAAWRWSSGGKWLTATNGSAYEWPCRHAICCVRDPEYPLNPYLQKAFQGAGLTQQQQDFNTTMSSARGTVEWPFVEIISLWAYVDARKQQRMLLQPVAMYYMVATLFINLRTFMRYWNKTSSFFGIEPPSLMEYLQWTFRYGSGLYSVAAVKHVKRRESETQNFMFLVTRALCVLLELLFFGMFCSNDCSICITAMCDSCLCCLSSPRSSRSSLSTLIFFSSSSAFCLASRSSLAPFNSSFLISSSLATRSRSHSNLDFSNAMRSSSCAAAFFVFITSTSWKGASKFAPLDFLAALGYCSDFSASVLHASARIWTASSRVLLAVQAAFSWVAPFSLYSTASSVSSWSFSVKSSL